MSLFLLWLPSQDWYWQVQRMAFLGNNDTKNERKLDTMRIKDQRVTTQGESENLAAERAELGVHGRNRVLIPLVIDEDCLQASVNRFRNCNYLSPFFYRQASLVNSNSFFTMKYVVNQLLLHWLYFLFMGFFFLHLLDICNKVQCAVNLWADLVVTWIEWITWVMFYQHMYIKYSIQWRGQF